MPKLQKPERQSPSTLHVFVRAHGGHAAPPQSTSVSSPVFEPSVQEGGGAAQIPASQIPLMQSVETRQAVPIGHGLHPPPQSTPVSGPLRSPSVQVASAHCPPRQ
jgi:hypothetical protein